MATLATIDESEIEYEDYVSCGQRLATFLKDSEGVDIVIALTHMRMPNDMRLAEEVSKIDLILGGHDHMYKVEQSEQGTYVIKSGTDFRDLSEVRFWIM